MERSRLILVWTAAIVAAVLAGCLGPAGQESLGEAAVGSEPGMGRGGRPHVVVALFDSGINPYTPVFRAPGFPEPASLISGLPPYETRTLSFDLPYDEAIRKDGVDRLVRDRLYWFRDTPILAYARDEMSGDYRYPALDELGHGTALASLVARVSPAAIILSVETGSEIESMLRWAAEQDWIDVISISRGPLANLPVEFVAGDEGRAMALKDAVERGKLVVGAAGNEPVPPLGNPYPGPPWTIGVGGAWSETRGETVVAAKTPDFVSEFVAYVSKHNTTKEEWWWRTGTSYSAPVVAGVIAEGIYAVRSAWGYGGNIEEGAFASVGDRVLTNADVRLALNRSTVYWSPQDYRPPSQQECPECLALGATAPVAPEVPNTHVGPWLQMGWGFVNQSTVPQFVRVLLGEEPLPEKPAGAVEFMGTVYEARELYWSLPRPR